MILTSLRKKLDVKFKDWKQGKDRYATKAGFTTGNINFENGNHNVSDVTMPSNAPSIVSDYASSYNASGKKRPDIFIPHSGLDITARKGYPVIAAADGKVVLSETFNYAGQSIVIEHAVTNDNKLLTAYIHLKKRLVKPGELVKRGQFIGMIGRTGKAWGKHDHLHWGVDLLPKGEADKAFYKHHVNPHNYWYDGIGRVSCFEKNKEYADQSKFTYPVPCI